MNIKQIIFNDFGLKLTALLLAIVVWVTISGEARTFSEKTFEVNVEIFNVSQNVDVRSVNPEKVRVKVKGISTAVNNLTSEDFKIKIDLIGTRKSTKLNRLAIDFLEFPEDVKIESVYPQWLEITVEEFISKEVPVRILYEGRLKQGISVLEKRVVPDTVRIFGYKSEIDGITEVLGDESINRATLTESQTFTIPLRKTQKILRFEDIDRVKVSIVVVDKNEGKKNQ